MVRDEPGSGRVALPPFDSADAMPAYRGTNAVQGTRCEWTSGDTLRVVQREGRSRGRHWWVTTGRTLACERTAGEGDEAAAAADANRISRGSWLCPLLI